MTPLTVEDAIAILRERKHRHDVRCTEFLVAMKDNLGSPAADTFAKKAVFEERQYTCLRLAIGAIRRAQRQRQEGTTL